MSFRPEIRSRLSPLASLHDTGFDSSLLTKVLGVWKAGRGEVGQAVKAALAAGYRHIDDAWIYRVRVSRLLAELGNHNVSA